MLGGVLGGLWAMAIVVVPLFLFCFLVLDLECFWREEMQRAGRLKRRAKSFAVSFLEEDQGQQKRIKDKSQILGALLRPGSRTG